ncbi:MAG: hypothetical protein HRT71_13820 [Flavobacteriales bacterium]|nr:hypothetical protein [Flavobacteriales bacterium]
MAYSVADISGSPFTWTITGGTQATGTTTNAITVNWDGSGTGNVRVVETDAVFGAGDNLDQSIEILPIYYSTQSGDWTSDDTWVGGVAPTSGNYVEIVAGHTVTMDGNPAACYGLNIKGTALWTGNGRTTDVGTAGINVYAGGDVTDISKTGVLSPVDSDDDGWN